MLLAAVSYTGNEQLLFGDGIYDTEFSSGTTVWFKADDFLNFLVGLVFYETVPSRDSMVKFLYTEELEKDSILEVNGYFRGVPEIGTQYLHRCRKVNVVRYLNTKKKGVGLTEDIGAEDTNTEDAFYFINDDVKPFRIINNGTQYQDLATLYNAVSDSPLTYSLVDLNSSWAQGALYIGRCYLKDKKENFSDKDLKWLKSWLNNCLLVPYKDDTASLMIEYPKAFSDQKFINIIRELNKRKRVQCFKDTDTITIIELAYWSYYFVKRNECSLADAIRAADKEMEIISKGRFEEYKKNNLFMWQDSVFDEKRLSKLVNKENPFMW